MSSSGSVAVPPLMRQGQLVEEIARAVVGKVQVQWMKLRYEISSLAPYSEHLIYITVPAGEVEREFPPRGISDLTDELREVMYRPGKGTWFSAVFTITAAGAVDAQFNFDDEPEWSRPTEPVFYVQDLERFPRDESAIPEWLAKQLVLGRIQDAEFDKIEGPRKKLTPVSTAN